MSESEKDDVIHFQLCSRISTCCPDVVIGSKTVTIADDEGGRVELTREEFKQLVDKSNEYLE